MARLPPQALVLFPPPALVLFPPPALALFPPPALALFPLQAVVLFPPPAPVLFPPPALVLFPLPALVLFPLQALRFRPHPPLLPDLFPRRGPHPLFKHPRPLPFPVPHHLLLQVYPVVPSHLLKPPREGPLFLLPEPDPHPWGHPEPDPHPWGHPEPAPRPWRLQRECPDLQAVRVKPPELLQPLPSQSKAWSARLFSLSWIYWYLLSRFS